MSKSREADRFAIRSRNGIEHPKENRGYKSPEAVLSLALTRALMDENDGTWTVLEYEDEVYHVRKDGKTMQVVTP